jgi:GTP-sensing pleiotropic transcriptional regulator CodY
MSKKIKEIIKDSEFVKMYTSDLSKEELKALEAYTDKIATSFQILVDSFADLSNTEMGSVEIQETLNQMVGLPKDGFGEIPAGEKE